MKVLIVRLSSLGDVVHTYPALTDLAGARPEVEVDWLVDETLAAFAGLHPAVADVVAYAERGSRWPPTRWPARRRARGEVRRRLRRSGYDLVVDLQGLLKSALAGRLAGAPVAGYDARSIREPMATVFYARRYAVSKDLHAVERNRRLLAAALGYEVAEASGEFGLGADAGVAADGLPERFLLFVHGASWPSKLWPEENWRRLAERLSPHGLHVVLPWGSEAEKARAGRIAAGNAFCHVLPSRLEGAALAGLMRRARLSVGLDSGPMHLAAALAVPGVWLFGPTDPGLTGPYGPNQAIVRSNAPEAPCRTRDCAHAAAGRRCMDLVNFERVAAAAEALVATAGR